MEIKVNLSYDTPPSNPDSSLQQQSIFSLNFQFNYKHEIVTRDVQGWKIVLGSYRYQNPLISPTASCPIDPSLMAAHQDPSLLCNYIQNFLSLSNHNLDSQSRLYLAQTIANSLKSTTIFPLFQVKADVEIVNQEWILMHQPRQMVDGGDVVGESRVAGGGTGASELVVEELRKKGSFYYLEGGDGDGEECSICLENYGDEMEAIKMPECLHVFHEKCIFRWLKTKNSCPFCPQIL